MTALQFRVVGTFPLLMDKLSTEERAGFGCIIHRKPPKQKSSASRKIYRQNGKIGLPSEMLFASLRAAGRFVSFRGEEMISTQHATHLQKDLLRIQEKFLVFEPPQGKVCVDWEVDCRRQDIGGVKVEFFRPKFRDWGFVATAIFDDARIGARQVANLFEIAGTQIGLGSWSPENGHGPFGRFIARPHIRLKFPRLFTLTPDRMSDEVLKMLTR